MRLAPFLLLILPAVLAGCGGGDADKARKRPMMTVAVEKAAVADFIPRLTALGTVTPLQSVAVRTRVDGQITQVLFSEGQQVRAGQPLFRLDERAVRAQIAQNRAALASASATAAQAAADLKRTQALVSSGFVSKATIEQKQAIADTGAAGIGQNQAAITAAETSLSYLTIRAPVSGRTGEIGYKVGATVRAGDTVPLVTVNQLSPITARFAVPPEQIQTLRGALARGSVAVLARPSENAPPIATGRLVFLDNNVDPTTGTLTAKAQFDNRNDELWPGALVSVDLPLATPQRLISLPEAAIQNGRDGSFVWALGPGDKVKMPAVTVVGRAEGRAFIAAGLAAGTRVVSDALAKLKDGDAVRVKGAGKGGGPKAART